ncbi:MAG: metallophosphoesterase family protein [Oscillochloris sp.]|nr:metallophosphoesterase family protein [Oscillochloris sp.]
MRILIISDIHSNLAAIEAVFIAAGSYDALWCLGDTIGYGPRPNECITLMRDREAVAITGNHDLACLGKIDLHDFNPDARQANIWNGEQLSPENRAWLEELKPNRDIDGRFTMAHGSPRQPIWEYLLMHDQAMANFELFNQQVCLIGHSHVQMGFRLNHAGERCERFLADNGQTIDLTDRHVRYFINPGSVGQPRDKDPRAAYAILDTAAATIRYHRIAYDITRTQREMTEAGLPVALIRRLEYGI